MARIILTVGDALFLGQLSLSRCEDTIIHQFVMFVAVLTQNKHCTLALTRLVVRVE